MFAALKSLEDKALLALKISLDAPFLSKEDIESILGSVSPLPEMEIKVLTDPKEFSEYCLKKTIGLEHSWAGNDIFTQTSVPVLGDIQLGNKIYIEYSNNGSYGGRDKEYTKTDFSLDIVQVIYVQQGHNCNFNGKYKDEETHLIVIYSPVEGYKVSPEVQYILDNFKL